MQFNFTQTYILENHAVRLIPFESIHVNQLWNVSQDPDIWTFFLEKGYGKEAFNAYMQNAIKQKQQEKEYPFVVFDKRKGQYAGMTRLYEYSDSLKIIKLGHTWYGKDFQGTGLNKHTKYLLFEFAFEKLAVERVGLAAHAENRVSRAAMESVGCTYEGSLRGFIPVDGSSARVDCVLYSILRDEWLKEVKFMLKKKLN